MKLFINESVYTYSVFVEGIERSLEVVSNSGKVQVERLLTHLYETGSLDRELELSEVRTVWMVEDVLNTSNDRKHIDHECIYNSEHRLGKPGPAMCDAMWEERD